LTFQLFFKLATLLCPRSAFEKDSRVSYRPYRSKGLPVQIKNRSMPTAPNRCETDLLLGHIRGYLRPRGSRYLHLSVRGLCCTSNWSRRFRLRRLGEETFPFSSQIQVGIRLDPATYQYGSMPVISSCLGVFGPYCRVEWLKIAIATVCCRKQEGEGFSDSETIQDHSCSLICPGLEHAPCQLLTLHVPSCHTYFHRVCCGVIDFLKRHIFRQSCTVSCDLQFHG
jgi:hypothetical protein